MPNPQHMMSVASRDPVAEVIDSTTIPSALPKPPPQYPVAGGAIEREPASMIAQAMRTFEPRTQDPRFARPPQPAA